MNTLGSYKYKSWTIWGKSEYNKTWFCEPNFLFEIFPDYQDIDNYVINHRIYHEDMTTLNKTKEYLKKHGDKIKENLIIDLQIITQTH